MLWVGLQPDVFKSVGFEPGQRENKLVQREAIMANENAAAGGEFLTFTLGKEEYGIDILKVQEIRGYDAVTVIANTRSRVKNPSQKMCPTNGTVSAPCSSAIAAKTPMMAS